MKFNEELAMAGALELTDSELETAHGAWGGDEFPGYHYVWIRGEGWVLVPDYYGGWNGGWGGWNGGWGGWNGGWGGWGGRDRDFRHHDRDGGGTDTDKKPS